MAKKPKATVTKIDSNIPEILVYGAINEDMAVDFAKQLAELEKTNKVVNARINCRGGSVYDGLAMISCVRGAKCAVDMYVDGIAASMGSALALSGRKLYMNKFARLMTHKPSGGSFGNSDELRACADEIDQCEADIAGIMSARLGITETEVKAKYLNGKDNYFRADAALRLRLIDGVYDGEEVELPEDAPVDEVFNKFQTRFEAYLKTPTPEGALPEDNITDNLKTNNDMRQIPLAVWAQICSVMAITDSADDAAVVAAVKDIVNKAKRTDVAEKKLKDKEAEVEANLKLQTEKEVTQMLDRAFDGKKITAKQKEIFGKQYTENPEDLKEVLDSMGAFISVNTQLTRSINGSEYTPEVKALMDKGWDKLHKEGGLAELMEASAEGYEALYEKKFGYKPNEKPFQESRAAKKK